MQTSSKTYSGTSLFRTILLAGVIAGALDATAAIIDFYVATGNGPARIFVYIASGAFGKQEHLTPQSMIIFGVLFHFLIAIIFSAFYFWIYPVIQFLHKNKLLSAVLYGIFVWLVMNLLVVPLTITHIWTFQLVKVLKAALILIVCIGIPISFMATSLYKKISSE
ncbi:MAG: hypothetical protein ABI863_04030 [Ginsengibacter sp.]